MRKGEKAQFLIEKPPYVSLATVELLDFTEESRAVAISAKAAHRLGRDKMQSKEYEKARRLLLMAQSMTPQDTSVSKDLRKLEELEVEKPKELRGAVADLRGAVTDLSGAVADLGLKVEVEVEKVVKVVKVVVNRSRSPNPLTFWFGVLYHIAVYRSC